MRKATLPSLILLLTVLVTFLFPWFLIPIGCFVLGYTFKIKPLYAFLQSMLITSITWMAVAYYQESKGSISIAEILGDLLGNMQIGLVFVITGLTIGLVSGLSMLSGRLFNLARK